MRDDAERAGDIAHALDAVILSDEAVIPPEGVKIIAGALLATRKRERRVVLEAVLNAVTETHMTDLVRRQLKERIRALAEKEPK